MPNILPWMPLHQDSLLVGDGLTGNGSLFMSEDLSMVADLLGAHDGACGRVFFILKLLQFCFHKKIWKNIMNS